MSHPAPDAQGHLSPARVLVMTDQPRTRESVCAALGRLGWLAEAAANGDQGLARAFQRPPDLLLVDRTSPDGGCDVAGKLRAVLGQFVLLVALDDRGGQECLDEALAAGFDAVV